MRRLRKTYKRPRVPWDEVAIAEDRATKGGYGLHRKKEILKAQAILRRFRQEARHLVAVRNKEREGVLVTKLVRLGLLSGKEQYTLDDVLALTMANVLERRLQTVVFRRGLAKTAKQARQLIVHGHVLVSGRRLVYPSYLVPAQEELSIALDAPVKEAPKPQAAEPAADEAAAGGAIEAAGEDAHA